MIGFRVGRVASIASLLLAGCMTTAPYNADTFLNSGVLSGSIGDMSACGMSDTSIWVTVDGKGECVRYFHAGLNLSNELVHIWFHGDRMTQYFNREPEVHDYYQAGASEQALQKKASAYHVIHGLPYVGISRPGVYGSSGDHKQRRRLREIKVIDAAINELKDRYNIADLALSGQSGGGHVVASLLTIRDDITCAALTSGVVSVAQRVRIKGWPTDVTGYSDYFDPINHVGQIPRDEDRRIFIIGDPRDTNVPFQTQISYLDALKSAGHPAWLIKAERKGKQNHNLTELGFKAIKECAKGTPPDIIQKTLSVT